MCMCVLLIAKRKIYTTNIHSQRRQTFMTDIRVLWMHRVVSWEMWKVYLAISTFCLCEVLFNQGKSREVRASVFAASEMGTRHQQYSSVKVHLPLSTHLRKVRFLVLSLVIAISIAITFFVLYIIKRNEILRKESQLGCTDATCVKIAAGNLVYFFSLASKTFKLTTFYVIVFCLPVGNNAMWFQIPENVIS